MRPAGGTGVGVLQTAADEDILSIGVCSNQITPARSAKVLTFDDQDAVDNAVYDADVPHGAPGHGKSFNVMGGGEQRRGRLAEATVIDIQALITAEMASRCRRSLRH